MLRILTTLIRGAAAEAEQSVFDANAIRILEQQLRDAAAALEHSKRELACALAHRASETRAVDALDARIAELERSASDAIAAGRDDLATDVATVIAANEDERAERVAAVDRFDTDIGRLRQLSEDGRKRLAELRRGLEMGRAQEALRRAGANGRRALATGTGALREAEATLAKIRESHMKADDYEAARQELDAEASGGSLEQRLAAAGIGPNLRTKPSDVLDRLRRKRTAASPTAQPAPSPPTPNPK